MASLLPRDAPSPEAAALSTDGGDLGVARCQGSNSGEGSRSFAPVATNKSVAATKAAMVALSSTESVPSPSPRGRNGKKIVTLIDAGNLPCHPDEDIATGRPQSARVLLAKSSSLSRSQHQGLANGSCSGTGSNDDTSADTVSATYGHQLSLPRLPIPSLEETMQKFPLVLLALQDEEAQAETVRACREFIDSGIGPTLQQALVQYDDEGFKSGRIGSYVEEFWNEAYLSPDASVVLNLNPYFVLEQGPDPKIAHDQMRRAANLCFASLKIASALRAESMAPDTFKGKPLCMDQFKVLFGSSRQPAVHQGADAASDDVHVYSDSTHVVALVKNQFYYFPALWPETGYVAVDEGDILDILVAIDKHSTQSTNRANTSRGALGVLTSLPRSEWAVARQELSNSSLANQMALRVIDSALFILVLDDVTPKNIHEAAANMLHGTNELADEASVEPVDGDPVGTLQVGSCLNRWYDKLQLIVCKDGTAGCNFEHAVIDGHTALRFVSDVFAETVIQFAESVVDLIHGRGRIPHLVDATVERAAASKDPVATLDVFPKKLLFDLNDIVLSRIYYAETALCDALLASDTYCLEFKEYGKTLIVANQMSPDSFVQMSILLAYYKLYGKVVCMYEPVLTKAFYHGRTEAMRPVTPKAKSLCEVWCSRQHRATSEQRLEVLREATEEHSRWVRECAAGRGVDRHLYSLMCMAERLKLPTPQFFKSDAWKTLNHTVLSTSNCGNPALRLFGFGPVVPDGFGVGYIIKDSGLSYSVSSKHRQTERYIRSLRAVLREMQEVLKPASKIRVRPRLRQVHATETSPSSAAQHARAYGDFWGENAYTSSSFLEEEQQETVNAPLVGSEKNFFVQVKPCSRSVNLLNLQDIQVEIKLDNSDESVASDVSTK